MSPHAPGERAGGEAAEAEHAERVVRAAEETSVRKVAEDIYARSGVGGFFDGVQYAAVQSAIEKSVYFYAYSLGRGMCKVLTGEFGPRQNITVGYLSEMVHLPLTVPLEVVITRIITSKGRIKSLRQAFDEIVAERGLLGFYKGIGAYVVLCLKPALQYTVYEQLRRAILNVLSRKRGVQVKSLSAAQAFFLGALSRAIATVLIFPCIRVKKIVMSAQQDDAAIKEEVEPETLVARDSILGTLRRTVEQEGAGALFQGIGPELTRGVLSAALMLMIKEKLYDFNKALLTKNRS